MDMITMELFQHEHVNDNESKRGPKERRKEKETNSENHSIYKALPPLSPGFRHLFPYGLIAFHFQQKIAKFD